MNGKSPAAISNRFVKLTFLSIALLLIYNLCPLSLRQAEAQNVDANPDSPAAGFMENFDGVTIPQLPQGWTTTATGASTPFVTATTRLDTPPNAIFTNDPDIPGGAEIISPLVRVGGNAPKLIFRHNYQTEPTWDGGALEISINGGTFQDVVTAGGSFISGSYNGTCRGTGNPLLNRQCWTGNSNGFITTQIALPQTAFRQNVRFKWRSGADNLIDDLGWWIDTIQVTNAISGENTGAITIPGSGIASPYPSDIQVTGQIGLVTGVSVNLENFSHSSPDDVDILLVAPNGRKVVLMSDVGGTTAVNGLSLSFDDLAAASLPDNAPLASGSYKPTNFEPGDDFPAPAPSGAPTGNSLSILNGSQPNGTWKLFVVDDNGNNVGSVTGGWSIAVESSPDAIGIPLTGVAEPYPSDKLVSGIQGTITRVTVTLNGFTHTSPDDVDILLVAPNGRKIVLMSDVGGSAAASNLNLTFEDAATNSLPDNAPLASGSYKPTDFETGDAFPAPAPTGVVTGTTLNAFYGSQPNGVWKLFVVDDSGENLGSVSGGWSMDIQASQSACLFTLNPTAVGISASGGTGSFNIIQPTGCLWTATSVFNFVTLNTTSGGGNSTVNFTIEPNPGGSRIGIVNVSNGIETRSFQIQQGAGCPTSINSTSQNFGAAGGSGSVGVTAPGTCNWSAMSNVGWITIQNPTGTGSGTLNFNVAANTTSNPRTGIINFGPQTLVVSQAGARGKRFDFDGDGKADISVFRPSGGNWYVLASQNNSMLTALWGQNGDKVVAADYDGDRKTDFAVYRAGNWYWIESSTNTIKSVTWGLTTDAPAPADYDGDGKADAAVYRSSDGTWQIRQSSNGSTLAVPFGIATDKAVPADYDGDGRADIAVYRTGTTQSNWFILRSGSNTVQNSPFGIEGDVPTAGDFDGDGRDNVAVFRPSNGSWYVLNPDSTFSSQPWGASGDVPAPADYNGDGRTDYSVFRNGIWYTLFAGGTSFRTDYWGLGTDVPVPSVF